MLKQTECLSSILNIIGNDNGNGNGSNYGVENVNENDIFSLKPSRLLV